MTPQILSSIEVLESRIAPAGIVTVDLTAGTLGLTAASSTSHFFSVEGIVPGSIVLSAQSGTLFHMGTGADTDLLVFPIKSVANLHVNLAGDNIVTLSQLNLAGDLNIDLGADQGVLSNQLQIQGATVKGSFNLHAENSNYNVNIGPGSLVVKKDATIDLGNAGERMILNSDLLSVGGNFSVTDGANKDTLQITSTVVKIGGSASLTLASGSLSQVSFTANTFSVGKDLTVSTGLSASVFSFAGSAKIKGIIDVIGGNVGVQATKLAAKSIQVDGSSTAAGLGLNLTNSSIPGGISTKQALLSFAEQNSAIGPVIVHAPDGPNSLMIQGSGGSLKGLSYIGGSGHDVSNITLVGTKIAGAVDLEEGDNTGTNTINLSGGASIGGMLQVIEGSGGLAELDLLGANAKIGGLNFTTGDQINPTFSLAGSTNLSLKNGLNVDFETTNGDCFVDLSSASLHVGKAITLTLKGQFAQVQSSELGLTAKGFQVTSTAATNTFELSTEHSSFGAVAFVLATNDNTFEMENLGAASKMTSFSYKSAGTAPKSEEVLFAGLQVSGKTDVQMGNGTADFMMMDTSIGGLFNLSTGDGDGTISIGGQITFAKAVTINLGAGDDDLTLGGDGVRSVVTAKSTFSVDGGAGANTISNVKNHFAVTPVLTGFP